MKKFKRFLARVGAFVPRGIKGIVVLAVVAVVAFGLGGLLGGSGDPAGNVRTGHDHEGGVVTSVLTLWTCSMHPQIKLPKPGKCPICFMDLIPLDTGSSDELGPRQLRMSDAAKQLARIQTTPARRGSAAAEVRLVGKIAYDETNLVYIAAWVPGRLDRLFADFTGTVVKKGNRLAQIYSPELLAAQEELIQARAAVSTLDKTQSSILRSTALATSAAARDKLRLFGLTPGQIETIETTQMPSEHLTIYAPVGGVVVHKDAKEGMYVSAGTRLYTIADLSKLWVLFEAHESDLFWLRNGQRVTFTVPALPGERFETVLSFVDPVVDAKTRTVRVRAVVENEDNKLKPDMFVSGVVRSSFEGQAPLLIPASAPLFTGRRAVAYVEVPSDEGPLYEGRELEMGPRAGEFYVVNAGLEEGELVVSNGAFKIDSELQIQAKPSMMSPSGGALTAGHQHGSHASETETRAADAVKNAKPSDESAQAREALTPVYEAYFGVQMALAKDDLGGAQKAAATLSKAIAKVDMMVFSQDGHGRWMELSKKMTEQSGRVAKAKDIAGARDGFFHLSRAAIDLHKSFGHAGKDNFYLTHCPMARDGAGADWLQEEDIVWNSFYGAMMLRCGSIEDKLAPAPGEKK